MSKYIDAEKLIRSLAHYKQGKWGEYETLSVFELESAIENFADTNEADVQEVRHGRWVDGEYTAGVLKMYGHKCSVCGAITPVSVARYRYCPNCGAKMDEVEE